MSVTPNLIFNRMSPSCVSAAPLAGLTSVLAPFHSWRHERKLQRLNSEAASRIRTSLPGGFSPRSFAATCRGEYERLFAALDRGDLGALKRSLSASCMASTRTGQEAAPPLRARIVAWDEQASGVASCGLHALTRSDGSFDKPPDFVQVTVRAVYDLEMRGGSGGGLSGRPPPHTAPPRKHLSVPPPPLWETALHQGTGTLYWWDRLMPQRVTWDMPNPGAFLAAHVAHPFRLETSGRWELDAGGSRARVMHDVVWERAVAGGSWYIVRW